MVSAEGIEKQIDQTISIVTDTQLVADHLEYIVQSEGYEVFQIFNTQLVSFDQFKRQLKPSKVWLVELKSPQKWSDWWTHFTEMSNQLVFFGDATAPADRGSEEFVQWRRRFITKIRLNVGKPSLKDKPGAGIAGLPLQDEERQSAAELSRKPVLSPASQPAATAVEELTEVVPDIDSLTNKQVTQESVLNSAQQEQKSISPSVMQGSFEDDIPAFIDESDVPTIEEVVSIPFDESEHPVSIDTSDSVLAAKNTLEKIAEKGQTISSSNEGLSRQPSQVESELIESIELMDVEELNIEEVELTVHDAAVDIPEAQVGKLNLSTIANEITNPDKKPIEPANDKSFQSEHSTTKDPGLVGASRSDVADARAFQSVVQELRVDTAKKENALPATKSVQRARHLPITPAQVIGDFSIWCIAASFGGPMAMKAFLRHLKPDLPVAFVLVQHIEHRFLNTLVDVLEQNTSMNVSVADHGDRIECGRLLITPVEPAINISSDGTFCRSNEPWSGPYEPSVDQVMDSMLKLKHLPDGAIVLTGMGNDGQMSASKWVAKGIPIWVQDPKTCEAPSMPEAIIDSHCASLIDSPDRLAGKLSDYLITRKKTGDVA